MSILRLAFSFLVIFGLWSLVRFRWIPRFLAYLRRNYTTSGALASLIDNLEQLELEVKQTVHNRSNRPDLFPVDLQQRSAKLPDLLRSSIVSLKDVQSSPHFEGHDGALKTLLEVMNEIDAVEEAVAQLLAPGSGAPGHPTLNVSNEA